MNHAKQHLEKEILAIDKKILGLKEARRRRQLALQQTTIGTCPKSAMSFHHGKR
jgi:hypothetical protein